MALPASGQITLNQVNVELGLSGTAQIGLGDSAVRGLFGVATGQITMSDGYGASSGYTVTVSSNVSNANLATIASSAGWNGSDALFFVINSGVYVYANASGVSSVGDGTPGLLVSGTFSNGVTIKNSGYIMGQGGGAGGPVGTPALKVTSSSTVVIENYSGAFIAGGGGAGYAVYGNAGGGAGGGLAGSAYGGGAGGSVGNSGGDGGAKPDSGYGRGGKQGGGGGGTTSQNWPVWISGGGGGGRIVASTSQAVAGKNGGYGGSGGSVGQNTTGSEGSFGAPGGAGGGGFGAAGGNVSPLSGTGSGPSGGPAISGTHTKGTGSNWAGTVWGTS